MVVLELVEFLLIKEMYPLFFNEESLLLQPCHMMFCAINQQCENTRIFWCWTSPRETKHVILLYCHSCRTQCLFSYHLKCDMTEAVRNSSYRYLSDCTLSLGETRLISALDAISVFLLAFFKKLKKKKKTLRRKRNPA